MTIELGYIVRDKVTGLIGVAENRAEYMHGCDRYYVQPQVDKDGKIPEGCMIDGPQLELTHPPVQVMVAAAIPERLIEMGQLVADPISGMSGTATGRAVYLNGCSRIHVTPPRVNENSPAPFWIAEKQLTGKETFFSGKAKIPVKPEPEESPGYARTGGPAPSCSKY